MLTVSHLTNYLSSTSWPSTVLPDALEDWNYCNYCGCMLAYPPEMGQLADPLFCPLRSTLLRLHARPCVECSKLAACLWYYRGNGQTEMEKPPLRGAQLDVYVWVLRQGSPDGFQAVPCPYLARELRYAVSTVRNALQALCRRGLLEKRRKHAGEGPFGCYRPLLWQKPKGE